MGLTVVTHSNKLYKRDLTKCIESVAMALPVNARHVIVDCNSNYSDFIKARYDALQLDDIIVFVDDDDYISKDSLTHCVAALANTTAGISFTREIKVNTDGTHQANTAPIYCRRMADTPEIVHHMTAIRTSCVSDRSLLLSTKYDIGIEWIIKVDAAFSHGAVHVPIDGYFWVQHAAQHHRDVVRQQLHRAHTPSVRAAMLEWGINFDKIQTWTPAPIVR